MKPEVCHTSGRLSSSEARGAAPDAGGREAGRPTDGYSLTYGIYIWDMESLYRFSGRPCSTFSAYTDTCETLGCSGRTLRIILSSKSKLQNLIGVQQRARRALAARRHCVGGAVATTMAGSWWGSLSVIYECCGLCISMAVTTEALDTAGVR